jgi:hypothetical protein
VLFLGTPGLGGRGLGLAQPSDLPERLIGADPDTFFGHFLDTWTKEPEAIPADVWVAYLAVARRPERNLSTFLRHVLAGFIEWSFPRCRWAC